MSTIGFDEKLSIQGFAVVIDRLHESQTLT